MGFLCLCYANAYSITIHHNILSCSTSSSRILPYFHRLISKSRGYTNRWPTNFTVQLFQQRNRGLLHLAPISNVNAGRNGGEWSNVNEPNAETEVWDYFKQFQWEDLVLPAGFGIVVAVPAARQRAMVFFVLSLFIYLVVQKASAFHRGQLHNRARVSPKSVPYMLITAKKFIASRGLLLLVGFTAALYAVLRKIQMYVNKFVAGAEKFLVPLGQEHLIGEKQLNGPPSNTLHRSVMAQHQEDKGFKKDLPPSNSSHTRDSSKRVDFDRGPDHLGVVLSDVKICISKLEDMMEKKQSSLTLGDMVCTEVRKTLDLLKVLNTDRSLKGDRHDLSQLQLMKENFETMSDELAKFDSGQLCSTVDAAENTRHEILKATSQMKETEEGDRLNIPASSESKSAALSLSAPDSLSISHGVSVNQGIRQVTKVKGVSAGNILAQGLVMGDASFCQKEEDKDLASCLTDRGAVSDSDGEIMLQSNPPQAQPSSNVGLGVSMRVESPLLQSTFDSSSWKADRNQINGRIMSSVVQASVVNESNALRREGASPKTSQDAGDSRQVLDEDDLESAFDTSTTALTGNLSDSTERNIEECNKSNSSSEDLSTEENQAGTGFGPQERLHNRKVGPEEQRVGKDQFDSVSSIRAERFSNGIFNGASQRKKYNDISEYQRAIGRKSGVKRPQQAREDPSFEADSHKDDSMKYVDYPDDDMKSDGKSFGSRDGRKSYKKVGKTKNDDEDSGDGGAPEGTGQRLVTSGISPTGSTGQQISQRTSGDSGKSSFREGDGSFWSESTKKSDFMQDDQDLPHRRGLSSRKQKEEHQRMMDEGEAFFTKGKAGLSGRIEVGVAETMLYKAVDLFASAAAIDPCSIEAVGFWGNTLLVHGELKLKVSRELRMMLPSAESPSTYQSMLRRRLEKDSVRGDTEQLIIQQTLQAVCEECEGFLVEAGRKYRRALSINKSDIRALYNWGLALCFRAQLIAEGGGQNAAEDADKVYIAAIDKFEAMMGISQRYAPGAMLNWGLALRDRSRLRPVGSKDRIQLLQQAKQLFQDALQSSPDDAQIRGSFATCNVELKEMQEIEAVQSRRSQLPKFDAR